MDEYTADLMQRVQKAEQRTALRQKLISNISDNTLMEICKAYSTNRLIVTPPLREEEGEGLKVKYRVYKARNNEAVNGCFVLRPEKDPAALAALEAYASATINEQLSNDIRLWIHAIKEGLIDGC